MKKSGLKLIALIIALAIVIGLLYWLSSGFTERNVKRWGDKLKRSSNSAYITTVIYDNADNREEVYFEKAEETEKAK